MSPIGPMADVGRNRFYKNLDRKFGVVHIARTRKKVENEAATKTCVPGARAVLLLPFGFSWLS